MILEISGVNSKSWDFFSTGTFYLDDFNLLLIFCLQRMYVVGHWCILA